MWKTFQLICVGLFSVILNTNGISDPEDVETNLPKIQKLSRVLFKQEKGRDFSNLETNEPGFNFTEAEMENLKIWPGGVIPYYTDTLSFDAEYRRRLSLFFDSVSNTVGVQFLKLQRPPKDEGSRWVLFLNRRGVLSSGGYTTKDFTSKGVQKVILGYDSPYNGELFETTLAILGVPPQHNAPDRDNYITVKYDNIMSDKKHLFDVLQNDEWLFHDLDYDYSSAGHYGLHKYSIGGFATIEPKNNVIDGIGDGQGFTYTDTWKIRMIYNYISKSRSNVIKKSDCLKMFKPGPKFDSFDLNEPSGPGPRPKPNKYLGKPDDKDDEVAGKPQEIDKSDADAEKLKGKRKVTKRPKKKSKSSRRPKPLKSSKPRRSTKRPKDKTNKSKQSEENGQDTTESSDTDSANSVPENN